MVIMNAFDRHLAGTGGPAQVRYGDGEFTVLRAGGYVVCAVTGKRISLDDLRYWSPDLQEAYFGPAQALERWKATRPA